MIGTRFPGHESTLHSHATWTPVCARIHFELIFHDGHDWWSQWKGADFRKGWDRLRQKGSVQDYKNAGTGGPTLYRHNEGASLAFYDGHAERLRKDLVWIETDYLGRSKRPGMWVADLDTWNRYR